LTTWLNTAEVEAPKFTVAAYTAVMESVPTGSAAVARVAVLLVPLPAVSVALPREVAPFMNVTEPVGAALPLETVAVKVTVCPLFAGFNEEATVAVVLAPLTTWFSADEVDAPKFPVAAYTTVMGSVPAGSAAVLNVAVLLTPLPGVSVALPREVAPFINVTDPVGAALPLETVAVKVTVCPLFAGFNEEATVAVVLAPLITWLSAGEVAAPKFAVPAYTTVIESVPTGRAEVERVAVLLTPPPAVSVALPREVAPFINVTEPVGAAVLLVSVAVKVTDCPALAGFSEDTTAAVLLAALTTWLSVGEVAVPKFAVAA
jgi:hypothetical protein